MSESYAAGGYIPGSTWVELVLGERIYMQDGRVLEWTGRGGWQIVPDAYNPLARGETGDDGQ